MKERLTYKEDTNFSSTSPWIQPSLFAYYNDPITNRWKKYFHLTEVSFYEKRSNIIAIGDKIHNKVYYVKKGIIQYNMIGKNGLEKVSMIIGPGCLSGEELFFHKQPSLYNAEAMTDVEVYTFSKEVFLDIIKKDFDISLFIMKVLALKCRVLATQVEDLSFRTTLEKVCRVLYCYYIYENQYTNSKNSLRLSHQDLANITGAHRVSITNTLSKLRKDGIIDHNEGTLMIKDNFRLRKMGFGY